MSSMNKTSGRAGHNNREMKKKTTKQNQEVNF